MQHGKSTFAKLLVKEIEAAGHSCKLYNFAFALKRELSDFIRETYGFDSFSEKAEEKSQFRAELIRYGQEKRAETNGNYFVDIVAKEISAEGMDYAVIGDWRYVSEHRLIEDFGRGIAAHITKWDLSDGGRRVAIPSDNEEENENDPLIKGISDYFVNWTAPTNGQKPEDWCKSYVKQFFNHYERFFQKSETRTSG